jgi:hypothetical protein
MAPKISQLERIRRGLEILGKIAVRCEIEPITASFPNGAPDFSRRAFLDVEVEGDFDENDLRELKSLGWSDEWPHFAYYGN